MRGRQKLLENCCLCGHRCGVNRLKGEIGVCRAGLLPEVASYCVHHGEEPVISGEKGSGTIFFAHCSLRCVFCQNYEISQGDGQGRAREGKGRQGRAREGKGGRELAEIMLELQGRGVHNINLVSPTHYGPRIIEALDLAREQGLKLPIVYNTGGYDSLELLKELAGKIDIYLPDFKYFNDANALKYSGAENYVATARAGVEEMWRQGQERGEQGQGKGEKGILVRHLVLPGNLSNSCEVLDFLASLSKDIWVSIMSQYSPQHRAGEFPELNRKLLPAEYQRVIDHAEGLGLHNLYVQELDSSEVYLPDFGREDPFQ
jgi:putative pyruvate formate lyase activating enzyme